MKDLFIEITPKEEKEAVDFMNFISEFTYEEFEDYKKRESWWFYKLLNWCRIRKNYPDLNKIRDEKFRKPAVKKRQEHNKQEIEKRMGILKNKFINEHLINEDQIENVKFRIIHYDRANKDSFMILAIPFDSLNLMIPKFWCWFVFWRKECPELFDERLWNPIMKFNWQAVVSSNSEKYNKRSF